MGLSSSLFAGVAGLNANGSAISVIGDNIANTNTTGFKSSRPEFADVLSQNLNNAGGAGAIGAGSRLLGINQKFTQGSLESTGVTTDLAVDGDGFFTLVDGSETFYSRAGVFQLNSSQVLVNSEGQFLQGFGVTSAGVPNGVLGNISLATVSSTPTATTEVDVSVNLDPDITAKSGAAAGFDHTDPVTTSDFQAGIRVYDSLGNPQNIQIYFRKSSAASNTWFWYAGANRGDLDITTYGAGPPDFSTFATPTAATSQFFPVQTGTLAFSTGGALTTETTTALSIPYDSDGDGTTDTANFASPGNSSPGWLFSGGAASTQLLTFDFGTTSTEGGTGTDKTTQFGGSTSSGVNNFVRNMTQDGFSSGSLSSLGIDESGFVTGTFTNGQTTRIAQVALSDFANLNGLERAGKNNFKETSTSGTATSGSPKSSGFGTIRSGFLEQSNTDLAEEFVRLILSQRAFQANTRTISTTNELLANLVALGT